MDESFYNGLCECNLPLTLIRICYTCWGSLSGSESASKENSVRTGTSVMTAQMSTLVDGVVLLLAIFVNDNYIDYGDNTNYNIY